MKDNNVKPFSCEDDRCDLNSNKICDNCGKCLELEGVDTNAIKISDIAKDVKENEKIEKEMENSYLEQQRLIDELLEKYSEYDDGTYEDAFEHIDQSEDLDLSDEEKLEDSTIELFPGMRILKRK